MRVAPVLGGVLALALLEAAVSTDGAAGRVGQLLDGFASVVSHVLSPTVPAIPDRRTHGGAATATAAPATGGGSTSGGGSPTFPADWNTSPPVFNA
jgi:hypothetical protein